jgi:hypothetical protein
VNSVIFAKKALPVSWLCTKTQKIPKHPASSEKICKNDLTEWEFVAIIYGIS